MIVHLLSMNIYCNADDANAGESIAGDANADDSNAAGLVP